jgi:LmbE family N-acetylglucosaminyl deacetylase
MELKKVLIIAPHADDEVLGVGGTIDKFYKEGHEIHLIICSKRKSDLPEYTEITDGRFESVTYMNFQDESLNMSVNLLIKYIENVYNEIIPDIIFIPNKDDFNLDHKAVYEACEVVLRRFQDNPPEMVLMYEVPSSTTQSFNNNFKCNYYITLNEENVMNKVGYFLEYTGEVRKFPNPRSNKGIHTYAHFRGMECNSEYAEGFNLIYFNHR